LLVSVFLLISGLSFGQQPPPPPGGHGHQGNKPPNDTPLGSGLGILVALGLAYGGKKVWDFRKSREPGRQ
jgi:hypothetical protein